MSIRDKKPRQHNCSVPVRFWNLIRNVPDILDMRTMLYIGGNSSRLQMIKSFKWAGIKIDLIEIWKPYVKEIKVVNKKYEYFDRIILGDVSKPLMAQVGKTYDAVVWWHGPEHVDEQALPKCLANIERITDKVAVAACPHGHCGQGVTKDGNIFQRHRYDVYPTHFTNEGWKAETLLPEPSMRSHILAWYRP